MKHKIRVHSLALSSKRGRRWYVSCAVCHDDWVPLGPPEPPPDGTQFFGRRTWQEAFDLGLWHQAAMHG